MSFRCFLGVIAALSCSLFATPVVFAAYSPPPKAAPQIGSLPWVPLIEAIVMSVLLATVLLIGLRRSAHQLNETISQDNDNPIVEVPFEEEAEFDALEIIEEKSSAVARNGL